jgi:hypothetical protein
MQLLLEEIRICTSCGKTLCFEGYGLQPVHKGSKNNGLQPLGAAFEPIVLFIPQSLCGIC